MKLSIRAKLLASFLLILFLASFLSWLVFSLNDGYIRSQQISMLDDKALAATTRIKDYFLTIRQSQQELANNYSDNSAEGIEEFSQLAASSIEDNPSINEITLLSPNGREIAKITINGIVPAEDLGVELPTPWFDEALSTHASTSKTYFSASSISPMINVFTPALQANGSVEAVVKSRIELKMLPEALSSLNLGEEGVAYVVDQEGQIISHPHISNLNSAAVMERPVINKLITSGFASLTPEDHYYTNEAGKQVIASSNTLSELDWVLVVEQPTSIVFSQLMFTRNLLIGVFVAAVSLMLVLAIVVSNSLARPIRLLKEGTQKVRSGDLSSRTDVATGDELEELSESFNEMAQQLAERQHSTEVTNKRLSVERDRQSALLQSLSDGVIAVDDKGIITLFNKSAEKITGYRHQSAIGRDFNAVMQLYNVEELYNLSQLTNQSPSQKKLFKERGLSINTDNGPIVLSLTITPIQLDDNKDGGWIITFTDMTKEREFEAMKLDFVSMAAHELRTPLTSMRGYLSMLKDEAEKKLNAEENRYLDRSFISANQLNSLVENLLNLSRVERGALKLSIAPIVIEEVISTAIDNIANIAASRNIELEFKPRKTPTVVLGDNFRISEVLTNLIGNGINYTSPGGHVKIKVTSDNKVATIAVSDNGQGIPASSVSHLFTKFYRVQSTLAMGSKGTGLGLYISKAIVTAHKGKIWVESVEGKGSTFYFTIPLAPKDAKIQSLGK